MLQKRRNKWIFASVLLLNVLLCCHGVAYISEISSKVLLNWSKNTQFAAESRSEIEMTALDGFDGPGTIETETDGSQDTAATASQNQSTADSNLPPTCDQETVATNSDGPSLSQAIHF